MSKSVIFLLALGTLLLILGGALYGWKNRPVIPTSSETPAPVAASESTTPSTPETIDTSDWQTYRNEKYGFEFKYPKGWKLNENVRDITYAPVVSLISPESQQLISVGRLDYDCDLSFYFNESLKSKIDNTRRFDTLEEYLFQNDMVQNIEKTKMGGLDAYAAVFGGNGAYYGVVSLRNSHVYETFSCRKASYDQLTFIEKQIISSFQFINAK